MSNQTMDRRLTSLEAAAPARPQVFIFCASGQTDAEALTAHFGTAEPPAGTDVTIFCWQEAPE